MLENRTGGFKSVVRVQQAKGFLARRNFFSFPRQLYRDDPHWVPCLWMEDRSVLDRKNPFLERVEVQPFVAYRGLKTVGRIAAIIHRGYNRFYRDRTGFFSFLESIPDDETFGFLLDAASAWLKERGRESMLGPIQFFSPFNCGLLAEGFNSTPAVGLPYHCQNYSVRLEHFGFKPQHELYVYQSKTGLLDPEIRAKRVRLEIPREIQIRPLRISSFQDEVLKIHQVYQKAWAGSWGYIPTSPQEVLWMADRMRPYLDPHLIWVAESRNEIIGFALAFPDFHSVLQKPFLRSLPPSFVPHLVRLEDLRSVRVTTVGILPEKQRMGIGSSLVYRVWEESLKSGYQTLVWGGVPQGENSVHRFLHRWGASIQQTYRIYQRFW